MLRFILLKIIMNTLEKLDKGKVLEVAIVVGVGKTPMKA